MESDATSILPIQSSGKISCGNLADAMTNDGRRLNAPALPKSGKGYLDSKDAWLSNRSLLHARLSLGALQLFDQRPVAVLGEFRVATLDHRSKRR